MEKEQSYLSSTDLRLEDVNQLHLKLGHAGIARMERYLKSAIPQDIKNAFSCDGCEKSKITRASFKDSSNKVGKVFERIHADLIGPISPSSKGGYRYSLTLVDNFSGYISSLDRKSVV